MHCFKEEYKKNRIFFAVYLAIGIFIVGLYFLPFGTAQAADTVEPALSLTQYENYGGSFVTLLLTGFKAMNIAIAPSVVLSISAIVSIVSDFVELPKFLTGFDFGLMGLWPVRIIVLLWGAVAILPRFFNVTRIFGIATEEIDNKLGLVAMGVFSVTEIMISTPGGAVASARGLIPVGTASAVESGNGFQYLLFAAAVVILILQIIFFMVIRCLMYYISILLIPICSLIPGSSFLFEQLRVIGVFILGIFGAVLPGVFIVFYCILLVVALCTFTKSAASINYFKEIYVNPIFHKKRMMQQVSLTQLPKRHKAPKTYNQATYKLVLPVFARKKKPGVFQLYEKWYLLCDGQGTYLEKVSFFRKTKKRMDIKSLCPQPIYIRDAKKYCEIFAPVPQFQMTAIPTKKDMEYSLVCSKDYRERMTEIAWMTGFIIGR